MKLSDRSVTLEFSSEPPEEDKQLRDSLSAIVRVGSELWLASHERTRLERLSAKVGTTFGGHTSFLLSSLFSLPGGDDQEIDIEGLDCQDDAIWLVGSHSLKRGEPKKKDKTAEEKLGKLSSVKFEENRYTLARIPLEAEGQTGRRPSKAVPAALLPRTKNANELMDALAEDKHLKRFFAVPGKDNGFDIEGLAVTGDRVFLGLRGPVLRGWALLLELEIEVHEKSRLQLSKIGSADRPYRKHFLPLRGLGIRELCILGTDLLILAGPTMDLDVPVKVFKWKNAIKTSGDSLVETSSLQELFEVPFGQGNDAGTDHAEGMTLFSNSESSASLLVVYDAPAKARKIDLSSVKADVFEL